MGDKRSSGRVHADDQIGEPQPLSDWRLAPGVWRLLFCAS
jgi:hypothetical protein